MKFPCTFFAIALFSLVLGATGCGAATPAPTITPTIASTKTSAPAATITFTPQLSFAATNTPTDLEALDERTRFLFDEPASHVIDFFLEIQDYVRTDNKEKLAALILYPIKIHSIDGKDVEIKNEKEFIANYEKFATPKWKGIILAQDPAKLFTNWQGVMVNNGEMWFGPVCSGTCENIKYYILSISNDMP